MIGPTEATLLLDALAPALTQPTFRRAVVLLTAALLTTGCRTVANLLRTARAWAPGDACSFRRVFSAARWSGLRLACLLTRFLLQHLLPAGTVTLVGDDTVCEHRGKKVYGKARHRDPVRSSRSYTAFRYGHKWGVLAVLVRFPFAPRPWALPILVALDRSAALDRQEHRRHYTPAQQMQRLLRLVLRWFPDRHFLFVGDGGYGTHALARFAAAQPRLTLVSKLHPKAGLYAPPPPYRGTGRPRDKGAKLLTPQQAAGQAALRRLRVGWYGGGTRQVAVATGTGLWYQKGHGVVPLRWVFVRDCTGTHRDEFFFTTDASLTPAQVIGHYTGRWNIDTTFQEVRACRGLETTRGWCRRTVLRAAPCLFGLYTVVALLYQLLPAGRRGGDLRWPGKAGVTFADALRAVRRWLWAEGFLPAVDPDGTFPKLPTALRETLLAALAPTA
jgi:DDE superfamily endonuclease